MRIFRQIRAGLLVAAFSACCYGTTGCVESTFSLASDSSLPRWFTLPPGLTRRDVSVTLSYYTWGPAKFTLKNWKGKKLAEVRGREQTSQPLHLPGSRSSYPAYEVIIANGITEVIEHRRAEPLFYVADDPLAREELLSITGSHP